MNFFDVIKDIGDSPAKLAAFMAALVCIVVLVLFRNSPERTKLIVLATLVIAIFALILMLSFDRRGVADSERSPSGPASPSPSPSPSLAPAQPTTQPTPSPAPTPTTALDRLARPKPAQTASADKVDFIRDVELRCPDAAPLIYRVATRRIGPGYPVNDTADDFAFYTLDQQDGTATRNTIDKHSAKLRALQATLPANTLTSILKGASSRLGDSDPTRAAGAYLRALDDAIVEYLQEQGRSWRSLPTVQCRLRNVAD